MDNQRELLDSLMGNDRNYGKKESAKRANWWDDDLCKKYMVWDCPHDFFLNKRGLASTKSPVGECGKSHNDAMKARFEEDKDNNEKYRKRYLVDLEKQMKKLVEGIDARIERDMERLSQGDSRTKEAQSFMLTEIDTRTTLAKDKMLAAEEMAANGEVEVAQDVYDASLTFTHEKNRLERLKEKTEGWIDEICQVCGGYMSWRDTEELNNRREGRPHSHVHGIVHTGWTQMRDSFKRLQAEISRLKISPEDLVEEDESSKGRGRRESETDRERRRDSDRGRDDVPTRSSYSSRDRTRDDADRRDRNGDDRRRDDRGGDDRRHRDDRGYRDDKGRRDRDDGGRRDRDDGGRRNRDDRDRDRSRERESRRHDRDDRGPKLDEFGRDVSKTKISYKDNERSRSRGRAVKSDTKDKESDAAEAAGKTVQVEYSEDWEQVMERKFGELALDQDAWDMDAFDCNGKKIRLDAEVVELNKDSFPLRFKFLKKELIVLVPFSEDWEEVMSQKFAALALEQEAWDMTCFDHRSVKIDLNAEQVQIDGNSFPLRFVFSKRKAE